MSIVDVNMTARPASANISRLPTVAPTVQSTRSSSVPGSPSGTCRTYCTVCAGSGCLCECSMRMLAAAAAGAACGRPARGRGWSGPPRSRPRAGDRHRPDHHALHRRRVQPRRRRSTRSSPSLARRERRRRSHRAVPALRRRRQPRRNRHAAATIRCPVVRRPRLRVSRCRSFYSAD